MVFDLFHLDISVLEFMLVYKIFSFRFYHSSNDYTYSSVIHKCIYHK